MKGELVSDEAHVLRYVQPKCIEIAEDGTPTVQGTAFWSRPRDNNMPSYNWMECFDGTIEQQVDEIRNRKRMNYSATALLARLNVGIVINALHDAFSEECLSRFIHDPLDPDPPQYELDDPSHALMTHMPAEGEPLVEAIGDILAGCIIGQFPARPKTLR